MLPDESILNSSCNVIYRHYKARGILTLLQNTDKNPCFNNRDIDFICDIRLIKRNRLGKSRKLFIRKKKIQRPAIHFK